jgi:hypothetical protein
LSDSTAASSCRTAVAYRILIKASVTAGPGGSMAASVGAVAGHLDEIQQQAPGFLGFTLSSDRPARTVLFSMYLDRDDAEEAVADAYARAVTAINAADDGTCDWTLRARPEECGPVPA